MLDKKMSVWLEVVYRACSETISNVLHVSFSSGDLVKDCLGCWPNDAEIIVFKISKKTKRKEHLAYSIEYFISTNKEISPSRKKFFPSMLQERCDVRRRKQRNTYNSSNAVKFSILSNGNSLK